MTTEGTKPAEGTAPATTTESILSKGTEATPNFLESLPEDIRGEASLANFKDSAALAKSYINAQKMIGSSIRIPTPDTSSEATAEFFTKLQAVEGVVRMPEATDVEGMSNLFNKLGRPETHSDYKLDEGLNTSPEFFDNFAEGAHKLGASNELMNYIVKADTDRAQLEIAKHNEFVENGEKALKEKWGNDYSSRLEGAKAAAKMYADSYPDAMKALIEGPSGSNPALLAMLSELQATMVEKGTEGKHESVPYGTSADEAKFKIDEIKNNLSHAYHGGPSGPHEEALQKMNELYNLAYPSK